MLVCGACERPSPISSSCYPLARVVVAAVIAVLLPRRLLIVLPYLGNAFECTHSNARIRMHATHAFETQAEHARQWQELNSEAALLPNDLHPCVPVGSDEAAAKVLDVVNEDAAGRFEVGQRQG